MKIGITLGLKDNKESIWTNGIKQNSLTLQKMYKLLPNVGEVKLINFGEAKAEDLNTGSWKEYAKDIVTPKECIDKYNFDVIVTAMISPNIDFINAMNAKGTKIIKQIIFKKLLKEYKYLNMFESIIICEFMGNG